MLALLESPSRVMGGGGGGGTYLLGGVILKLEFQVFDSVFLLVYLLF